MDPVIRHPTPDEMPAFVTGDEHRVPRACRRREGREGRRGAPPELGPRPRLGRVRRRPSRQLVPLVPDAADRSGLRPGVGDGDRRGRRPRRTIAGGGSCGPWSAAEHDAARERGETLALLYAAEYPIYGRFGYGPATEEVTWTLDALAAEFHGEPAGEVAFVLPSEATRDEMIRIFETQRMRSVGEISRLPYRWDYSLGLRLSAWSDTWKGFVAFHRGPGGDVDGYVRFHAEPEHWERRQPRNAIASTTSSR
jgi:hypothetical protein